MLTREDAEVSGYRAPALVGFALLWDVKMSNVGSNQPRGAGLGGWTVGSAEALRTGRAVGAGVVRFTCVGFG